MVHEQLSADEQSIILRCMMILVTTDLFEEGEFHARTGFARQEMSAMAAAWPRMDRWKPEIANVAINNCLNEIAHGLSAEITRHYNLSWYATRDVYEKWLGLDPEFSQYGDDGGGGIR